MEAAPPTTGMADVTTPQGSPARPWAGGSPVSPDKFVFSEEFFQQAISGRLVCALLHTEHLFVVHHHHNSCAAADRQSSTGARAIRVIPCANAMQLVRAKAYLGGAAAG